MAAITPPDAERLKRVNALLEVALALPQDERAAWLKTLPPEHRPFVPMLTAMLSRASVETDTFLQRPLGVTLDDLDSLQHRPDAPEDVVGPYRLVSELGAGGMSTVWLAERTDGVLQRLVALKLPREGWALGLAQRMARERNILAALEHPRIARLYDAGVTAEGRPWLAMEWVSGVPIDEHCRERGLDVPQRLRLFLQVAEAVAHAHARLIVHRDLKPNNILVTPEGEVRLLDFGVAKLIDDDAALAPGLTQLMGRAVTPDYASPEQVSGRPVGVATDVYSLGVVLYELLTGQRPYRLARTSAAALEEAVLSADIRLASTRVGHDRRLARALRGDLDTILAKALSKGAGERYPSVESMAADIERHLNGEPVLAQPRSRWYSAAKFVQRNRLPVAAASVTLTALVVGLGLALWQAREATRQRVLAQAQQEQTQASLDFTSMVLTEGIRAGEAVTLDELVQRSESMSQRAFGSNITERAVAADTVAAWLLATERNERAEQVLTRAIDALPADADRSLVYNLRCQRAAARYGLGRNDEAIRELDAVIAAATPAHPGSAWYCLQRRTTVAYGLNDAPGALRHAQAALQMFDLAGNRSALRRALLLANEAYALTLNGQSAQADHRYRRATELLASVGRAESTQAVGIYGDWAIALWSAGDPRAALVQLDRGRAIAEGFSPTGDAPGQVYGNQAHTLRALGRLPEAGTAFERLQRIARRDNNAAYETYALAGLAIVALRLGQPERARAALAQGDALLRRAALPAGSGPARWLKFAQALAWQADGRLAEADQALAEVLDQFTQRQASSGMMAELAISRSEVALVQGRLDAARGHGEQALAVARAMQGDRSHSVLAGQAWLALAKVHRAAGRGDDARQAIDKAIANLDATVDADHPSRRESRQFAAAPG
jgi:eukaryotic-like serine/threonine-protein kinase